MAFTSAAISARISPAILVPSRMVAAIVPLEWKMKLKIVNESLRASCHWQRDLTGGKTGTLHRRPFLHSPRQIAGSGLASPAIPPAPVRAARRPHELGPESPVPLASTPAKTAWESSA